MIELYQFPAVFGVPNPSPFCMKVETWLRLAGLEYSVKTLPDPRKGPLGKLPYVKDGAKLIADSSSIIEQLSLSHDVKLDEKLSAAQKAAALAFDRMLCEHTYWGVVYSRWIEPTGWDQIRPVFFGAQPPVIRTLVAGAVRKQLRRALWQHGLGRHDREEVYRRMGQDLAAVAAYLGEQPFMMGEQPSNVDATVYAFLASCWEAQLNTPMKALVGQHQNLVAYCRRMRERCFGAGQGG